MLATFKGTSRKTPLEQWRLRMGLPKASALQIARLIGKTETHVLCEPPAVKVRKKTITD